MQPPKETRVQARIDGATKMKAEAVLSAMGLSTSTAIRMFITQIARDKELPFTPFIPNATTIKALQAVRRGETVSFDSVEAFMKDLHAED